MQKNKVLGITLLVGVAALLWAFVLTVYLGKNVDEAMSVEIPQALPPVSAPATITPPVTETTAPSTTTQTYEKPESTRTTHSS